MAGKGQAQEAALQGSPKTHRPEFGGVLWVGLRSCNHQVPTLEPGRGING